MNLCEWVKKYPQFAIECHGPDGMEYISFAVSEEEIKQNDSDHLMAECIVSRILVEVEKLND